MKKVNKAVHLIFLLAKVIKNKQTIILHKKIRTLYSHRTMLQSAIK